MSLVIICKRSGLEFEASSKRYKQHPQISSWLQQANQEGWYSDCVQFINDSKGKLNSIEEFIFELHIVREQAISVNKENSADEKRKWDQITEENKQRRRDNARLKRGGYLWKNLAYEPDDPDQADWKLISPDGKIVSIHDALKELAD